MFDISSIMMRRSASNGSNCFSSSLLSLSPTGWNPSRPTISPPSVTSSSSRTTTTTIKPKESGPSSPDLRRTLSPEPSSRFTISHQPYAYSSWPLGDSLTPANGYIPTTCYFSPNYLPSSRISDDELESLDFSRPPPRQSYFEPVALDQSSEIIPALQVCERRSRLPPPPPQYRRRSSSRKSPTRKSHKTLVAIAE